jgi:hypothetical protein
MLAGHTRSSRSQLWQVPQAQQPCYFQKNGAGGSAIVYAVTVVTHMHAMMVDGWWMIWW